jgi:pimeloyl-ACP methyl ester carboxylesterase
LRRGLILAGSLGLLFCLFACSRSSDHPEKSASLATRAETPPSAGQVWQFSDPAFSPLAGARALYGRLGNALYEIEVPTNWNGDVVLYAHGFNGSEPFLIVSPPPLRQHFVDGGFAWAASSFSANGYDPQAGVDDTLALLDYFRQNVGAPQRAYIYGSSMGGHVVVSSLEQHPDAFAGAFSECGVVAGVEEMDYLVGYEALGQYMAGLELLPPSNIETYKTAVMEQLIPALGNPSNRRLTAKGRAFENVLENLTGGPRPFRHEGFLDRFSGDFTVTFDDLAQQTLAARAATNANVTYHIGAGFGLSDSELNSGVYRLTADPSARNATSHPAFAPLTGKLTVPLLTLHTTGDGFVPFSMEQDYRRAVDAAGNGSLLVQRAIRRPDHCQFTEAEREQAWDDLVQWVEGGTKPAGDDVLSSDLSQIGLQWTKPLLPGDPGGL